MWRRLADGPWRSGRCFPCRAGPPARGRMRDAHNHTSQPTGK